MYQSNTLLLSSIQCPDLFIYLYFLFIYLFLNTEDGREGFCADKNGLIHGDRQRKITRKGNWDFREPHASLYGGQR